MPNHSDDARIKLFTPLFIDFLQQKFFGKETDEQFENKSYDYAELVGALPSVYKDSQLIQWGVQYLESKGIIRQVSSDGTKLVKWELTDHAIKDKINEKASNDLNRRIELEIKRRNLDQLQAAAEDRQLIKDQIQSTIETNSAVKRSLRRQTVLTWLTIGVAALSLVAISFSAYYAKQGITGEQLLRLDTTIRDNTILLDSMLQAQKEIDLSLQKAVKDSFYRK